jgi:hypothetical protein
MMSGGMGSMMGAMAFGWLIAIILVIGGAVLLVKLLSPTDSAAGGVGNIIVTVLAVIGGLALVTAVAMGTMHFGMMR